MCGITGLINKDGSTISSSVVEKMTEALEHRGPDAGGVWLSENVGIGHRRLSVIDLSDSGNQPMVDETDNYVLSYNGEIYNFKELRKLLEKEGFLFKTGTDTEVVLNALIMWGVGALDLFNGMFAIAFWNKSKNELLLARDRYGVKPLYYSDNKFFFAFASEQKAIREVPNFKNNLDLEALVEYFTFQNIFTDRTFDSGIRMIEAGSWMLCDFSTSQTVTTTRRYWDYSFEETEQKKVDHREYVEEFDRLFVQAVKRNLVSDVEIGSYLSGGMDSGSITAVASENLKNFKTFTCGFDLESVSGLEMNFDEREYAQLVSKTLGTDQHEIVLESGDMEKAMHNLVKHLEEPRVGQSYPNYYASSLSSSFVKVVLSGTGGDELFGGYPWRYFQAGPSDSFEKYIDKYYLYWQRLISNTELKKIFAPISSETKHLVTRDIFRDVFPESMRGKSSNNENYVNRSLYFELKTFLHGLLAVEDKLSMAHGLETRVPFLDNDLVDFALKCPVDLKLKIDKNPYRVDENISENKSELYFERTNNGKLILREAMAKRLPSKVVDLEKRGFSGPDASWYRGQSIEYVKTRLVNIEGPMRDLVDRNELNKLLDGHFSGKTNRRLAIWSFLYVDEYLRQLF